MILISPESDVEGIVLGGGVVGGIGAAVGSGRIVEPGVADIGAAVEAGTCVTGGCGPGVDAGGS